VLSVDPRLFSYLPWYGSLDTDLGGSRFHTFERLDDIQRLAAVTDPAAFANLSRNLTYGHVDVAARPDTVARPVGTRARCSRP
jgi:hypothetical protein